MSGEYKEIENLFNNLIIPGVLIKEKEVVPGVKIKLKPLDVGEIVMAENMINNDIPKDIATKLRAASILSRAIISINDLSFESEVRDERESKIRTLYSYLLKLPPLMIFKAYDFYLETVKEHDSFIMSGKRDEEIGNF